MDTIFISYRRSDAAETAGRMFDRLAETFGPDRIFKDVDSIPLDSFFQPYVLEKIRTSVVLALIGPQWATCTDIQGGRRLDAETDLVRQEIETAIECGVPLIPILVSKATMPAASELPPSIRSLVERQAHSVRPDPDFHNDMDRLISSLEALVGKGGASPAAPRELLERILADCQGWHTEIVNALAKMSLERADQDGAARAQAVDFVYQNTRNHFPRIVSAKAALGGFEGTERVTAAIDGFLAAVTVQGDSALCAPLASAILAPSNSWWSRFGLSAAPKPVADRAAAFLVQLNQALQRVSGEVTALTASDREPTRGRGTVSSRR